MRAPPLDDVRTRCPGLLPALQPGGHFTSELPVLVDVVPGEPLQIPQDPWRKGGVTYRVHACTRFIRVGDEPDAVVQGRHGEAGAAGVTAEQRTRAGARDHFGWIAPRSA